MGTQPLYSCRLQWAACSGSGAQIGQITAMRQHRPALSPHLSPLRDFSRCDIVTRMTGQSDNRSDDPRDFSATSHPPVHPVTTVVGPVRSQTRYSGLLPGLTSSPLTALLHCHCAESARVGRMVHGVQSPPVLGSATAAEELLVDMESPSWARSRCEQQAGSPSRGQ